MAEGEVKEVSTNVSEDVRQEEAREELYGDRVRRALINMLEDIKEQRDEIKKAYDQLKEATISLIQTEKMTALGELTASVAHELNQPLNIIKIIAQDILRDIKNNRLNQDFLNRDLTDIIDQVNKMSEIIDHMRIFTRRTEGVPKEKININEPIEGVFKFLGQQLKVHNIEVVKELGSGLYVLGDPIRLEQVFMNIIVNARDAVEKIKDKRQMKIEIKSYSSPDAREIIVEIKDNGCGMPESIINRIFEPFFTTKEPSKGTGLGLSVTKKIIEEHNGKIYVESKEGEGTIFKVILPAIKSSDITGTVK